MTEIFLKTIWGNLWIGICFFETPVVVDFSGYVMAMAMDITTAMTRP